jgi:hypothetical protein
LHEQRSDTICDCLIIQPAAENVNESLRFWPKKTGDGGVVKVMQRCITLPAGTSRYMPRARSAVRHRKAVRLNRPEPQGRPYEKNRQ